MDPECGNALEAGEQKKSWIVGHFVQPEGLRKTNAVEIKWGVHNVGESKEWESQSGKKTISILLSGEFEIDICIRGRIVTFPLRKSGDFVIWEDDQKHRWKALANSVVLTVRWPSGMAPPCKETTQPPG